MFAVMKRACLLSLLALALPAAAQAATTTVDPAASGTCARGGSCTTIAGAVGVAQAADTIHVKAGSYSEAVTVPSALSGLIVNGDGGAVLGGTLTVAAPGVTVTGLGIINTAGTAPALTASGGNLTVADATVASTVGTALSITGGTGNRVQRASVITSEPAGASDAIKLAPGGLTVDSSIVVGGAKGAAYRVTTAAGSAAATLTLNHDTTTGTGKALILDASGGALPLMTPGSITVAVASSIIHGDSTLTAYPGLPPLVAASTVTATFNHSDATAVTGTDGSAIAGTGNPTPDASLFRSKLHLKPTAPVIDQGGPLAAGESPQDVDGDPRTNGSATDIGADEYTNHPPALTFTVSPSSAETGDTVTVTGHATDPEGADDVIGYSVDWGDGTKRNQTASNVIQHVYAKPGTFTITMAAGDAGGAISNLATQEITLTDGQPPQLQLTTPRDGASVRVGKKPLTVKGVDADDSGVARVELALTKVGSSCKQYTGSRLKSAGCSKYTFLAATLHGNGFKLVTRKGLRIPKGTYEVRARATDAKGNRSSTFDKATRTLVRFKVK
jgi:hypothetical protein